MNGHPKVFGVPKGAVGADGEVISHHNRFVLAHYRRARAVVDGKVLDPHADRRLEYTLQLDWLQFRLNDEGDDLELLSEPAMLRQRGYETGEAFCAVPDARTMNHWAHPPEPLDSTFSRWCDTPHFNNGIAAIEYRFNPVTLLDHQRLGPGLAVVGAAADTNGKGPLGSFGLSAHAPPPRRPRSFIQAKTIVPSRSLRSARSSRASYLSLPENSG